MLETLFTSLAVLLRIVSNPLANLFQKQLTQKGSHPLAVNFLTYLLLALFCIFLSLSVNWSLLPTAFWLYSFLAGAAGASGNGFLIKALHKGELSVLGPINAYKAVVGLIAAVFLLGEVPNIWGLAGIALIIYGSYFVLDTTAEGFSWRLLKEPTIQYRILAMVLTAVEAVLIKKIIQHSSVQIAFISWCWMGAFFSFLLMRLYRVQVNQTVVSGFYRTIGRYLLLVVCIGIMQYTTNYAFDHMPIGYALSLFQLSTLVSILLGHKMFQEQNIQKKLIGSMIMIAGSVLIILFKNS